MSGKPKGEQVFSGALTPTPRRAVVVRDVLQALASSGFEVASTRGTHAKLRRKNETGELEILTIPLHREIAPGPLRASYRQACRFVPEPELRAWFYRRARETVCVRS